jgi:hypothetical protein
MTFTRITVRADQMDGVPCIRRVAHRVFAHLLHSRGTTRTPRPDRPGPAAAPRHYECRVGVQTRAALLFARTEHQCACNVVARTRVQKRGLRRSRAGARTGRNQKSGPVIRGWLPLSPAVRPDDVGRLQPVEGVTPSARPRSPDRCSGSTAPRCRYRTTPATLALADRIHSAVVTKIAGSGAPANPCGTGALPMQRGWLTEGHEALGSAE